MSYFFGDHTWVELQEIIKKDAMVVLPVGMYEEHGRQLPVSTDTDLVYEACEEGVRRLYNDGYPVLLLPAIWTGYHGYSVSKWPGGIRMQQETLMHVVYDIMASLIRMGIKKIVVCNGHGQNPPALEMAIRKIVDDFKVVPMMCMPFMLFSKEAWLPRTSQQGAMGGHADEFETSLMLYVKPELVKMDQAADDTTRYRSRFIAGDMFPTQEVVKGGVYWSTFNIQDSHNGAQGDPRHATYELGESLTKSAHDNFEMLLREYYAFNDYVF